MIKIVEAVTKRQMKIFATYPIKLYKKCPYYVPSLVDDEVNIANHKKNFSLGNSEVKCFLAYKDDKLVGRIAGIIAHDSNKINNERCIRFSRIDMIDDIEVTKALLNAVMEYGKSKGMEVIQGPWGFDDADREGMLTFGYNEYSSYATAYSYPYYKEHMEKLGYLKESEWVENRLDPENTDPRFPKVAEMLMKRGGYVDVCETMSASKIIKKYANEFFDCYNKAYAELDNFVKVDEKQKKAILQTFATLINTRYFSLVMDKDKTKVVAFGVGLPYVGDAIRKGKGRLLLSLPGILKAKANPRKVELALIGVDPEYRNSGVHAIVATRFIKHAKEDKLDDIFLDPTLTTNLKMLNTWQGMGKTLRCKRQTYRKVID